MSPAYVSGVCIPELSSVILNCSDHFKSFDPFAYQKKRSLTESVSCVTSLALHLDSSMRKIANSGNSEGLEKLYLQLLQVGPFPSDFDSI